MRTLHGFAAASLTLACFALPGHAGVISTLGSWNGVTDIGTFGSVAAEATPTYGETFTAAAGEDVLQTINFEIENESSVAIPYNAYVYAWDGSELSGGALFASGLESIPVGAGFQEISVSVPNLSLADGSQYVAFFSTIGDGGSNLTEAAWGGDMPDSAYPGGTFVYSNDAVFSDLSTGVWTSGSFGDLAFELDFASPAPEPSTLILVGGALLGLAGFRRKAARS
jgi:hypothetical protein